MVKKGESRHVVANPDGGWEVRKPGSARAVAYEETQAAAIARAREILRNVGGGEVRIHARNGQIRESDTIPPLKNAGTPPQSS